MAGIPFLTMVLIAGLASVADATPRQTRFEFLVSPGIAVASGGWGNTFRAAMYRAGMTAESHPCLSYECWGFEQPYPYFDNNYPNALVSISLAVRLHGPFGAKFVHASEPELGTVGALRVVPYGESYRVGELDLKPRVTTYALMLTWERPSASAWKFRTGAGVVLGSSRVEARSGEEGDIALGSATDRSFGFVAEIGARKLYGAGLLIAPVVRYRYIAGFSAGPYDVLDQRGDYLMTVPAMTYSVSSLVLELGLGVGI